MTEALRVGMIGVNARTGWARDGHVPAAQALEGLELVAVATRRQDSADEAAAAFGAERAYGDPLALVADPDVDVVAIVSPVPTHHELVLAALAAGRHVLTEWPLGVGTAQMEEMAAVAARSGRKTAVDLQARMSPAVARAAALIADGRIGRVLAATAYSTTAGFGRRVPESAAYLERPESGMNLQTIQTAHTLDLAVRLAGRLTSIAALTTVQYPQIEVGDPPRTQRRTVPDHVLVHGRLDNGGALAVQVVGGRPEDDTPFRLDVVGESATLALVGGDARGFQAGQLTLTVDGEPVDLDGGETAGLPDAVVNVARVYAALRDDIRHDTATAPDFDHAVRLAHLLDDLLAAAADGKTRGPSHEWP